MLGKGGCRHGHGEFLEMRKHTTHKPDFKLFAQQIAMIDGSCGKRKAAGRSMSSLNVGMHRCTDYQGPPLEACEKGRPGSLAALSCEEPLRHGEILQQSLMRFASTFVACATHKV